MIGGGGGGIGLRNAGGNHSGDAPLHSPPGGDPGIGVFPGGSAGIRGSGPGGDPGVIPPPVIGFGV